MEKDNIKFNGIDDSDDSSLSSVGHMIIHEDPDSPEDSSDSAYEADTIIDSPNSSSSTLQLNVSEDSNDKNDVNDNDINEEVQILEGPPAEAAAAALDPHIVVNYEEACYQPRAPHASWLLYDSCPGCACNCHRHQPKALITGNTYCSNMSALEESEEDDGDLPPLVDDTEAYALVVESVEENKEIVSEEDSEDL